MAYAETTDLFRILKVRDPSEAQTAAAQGDLDIASIEINYEIDLSDADTHEFTDEELELLKNVCVNRAADLWRHRESAPGIIGVLDESAPATPGRYSFARYVQMLAPLKDQWGVA